MGLICEYSLNLDIMASYWHDTSILNYKWLKITFGQSTYIYEKSQNNMRKFRIDINMFKGGPLNNQIH